MLCAASESAPGCAGLAAPRGKVFIADDTAPAASKMVSWSALDMITTQLLSGRDGTRARPWTSLSRQHSE
jgi:hypothetical protein